MNNSTLLLQKINTNTETVGIIGLGYVGLPLAVGFAQAGVKVIIRTARACPDHTIHRTNGPNISGSRLCGHHHQPFGIRCPND